MVKLVEVSDEVLLSEWIVWFLIRAIARLELLVETLPLLVVVLAIILILLDSIDLLLGGVHAEGLFESERIYLLENGFQSNQ